MSIVGREDELFRRWTQKRPDLVKDGVIDEAAYLASSIKVLFLLKEVNSPGEGGWDLRKKVRETGGGLLTNIARWSYGISHVERDVPWDNVLALGKRRPDILKSVCIMNLKKSPGGGAADHKGLQAIAEEDAAFIREQFRLYSPDLAILCGTGWLFDIVTGPGTPADRGTTLRGIPYRRLEEGKFAVTYWHPGARVGSCLLYYGLVDAVREILRR